MTHQKYRVGLLGAGYILQAHARAVRAVQGAELHAVCDLSPARARAAAQAHGIANVYTSLEELLRSDCDVVHVLLPPHLHAQAAAQCLQAGKHVLLEKPMAPTAQECRALDDLARACGLQLGVNHNFLFSSSYERLRSDVRQRVAGRLDHVEVNWFLPLGLLQNGPFDNWMVAQPGNLFLEVGPHLAAFAIDLLGPLEEVQAIVGHPIALPGGRHAFRHWHVGGRKGAASVALNLSFAPGQADRSLRIRGHAQLGQLDFGRDLYWRTKTHSVSTMFDNLAVAASIATSLAGQAARNFTRALLGALRKSPEQNPFDHSISRSVAAFYAGLDGSPDERLSAGFATTVMQLCESVAKVAGGNPVASASQPPPAGATSTFPTKPTALVVGGTGFIGKRLVHALVARGVGVRVLTRNLRSAQAELEGLAVDIAVGSHGDPEALAAALEGIEVVYHLAKASGEKWDDYVKNDIEPTRVLAEAALRHGVRRFIYTGTIDSYYSARARDVIDTTTPLDPQIGSRNHYGRSKAACEALLMDLYKSRGLPLVILRPGIVVGAGAPPAHWGVGKFESDTRVQLWGAGSHPLPFVLVDDVAQALALARDRPGIEGRALLLTDTPCLSAREYVQAVADCSGTRIETLPTPLWIHFAKDVVKEAVKHAIGHPNRRVPTWRDWGSRAHRARYDSTQTQAMLGWKPAGSRDALVRDGVDAAVKWYLR